MTDRIEEIRKQFNKFRKSHDRKLCETVRLTRIQYDFMLATPDAMDDLFTEIDRLTAENERLRESVRVFASAYYQAPYVSQQQDQEP